ncbi:MAG: alpha/beta hydrolase [Acetobacteraceae bacterium]|nr:alpha/beta hydrolase [Acetobacteraceae bacterium]
MRVLHVSGHDMAYAEHGTGTPLVLVHGTLLDQRYWAPQVEALGERYRVVAPSLRHYWPGRYDGSGEGFTIQRHVEDVAAFIEGLGAGPAHLLGHSRGGHIAFRVAQRFPDRVRALVLAEPGGTLDQTLRPAQGGSGSPAPRGMPFAEAVASAAERVRGGDIDGGLALFVEAVLGPGAWRRSAERIVRMQRDNARTLLGQVNERRLPYTRADMEAIRAPTLLVGGADTRLLFPPVLDAMERGIAGAERVDLPGTAHLMSDEDPAAFNSAVLGFLRGRR